MEKVAAVALNTRAGSRGQKISHVGSLPSPPFSLSSRRGAARLGQRCRKLVLHTSSAEPPGLLRGCGAAREQKYVKHASFFFFQPHSLMQPNTKASVPSPLHPQRNRRPRPSGSSLRRQPASALHRHRQEHPRQRWPPPCLALQPSSFRRLPGRSHPSLLNPSGGAGKQGRNRRPPCTQPRPWPARPCCPPHPTKKSAAFRSQSRPAGGEDSSPPHPLPSLAWHSSRPSTGNAAQRTATRPAPARTTCIARPPGESRGNAAAQGATAACAQPCPGDAPPCPETPHSARGPARASPANAMRRPARVAARAAASPGALCRVGRLHARWAHDAQLLLAPAVPVYAQPAPPPQPAPLTRPPHTRTHTRTHTHVLSPPRLALLSLSLSLPSFLALPPRPESLAVMFKVACLLALVAVAGKPCKEEGGGAPGRGRQSVTE